MHTQILRRAGIVLVVIGLIDIAVMIYCIVSNASYSSSFNVFAVIAGVFLIQGSLKAASIIRWLSALMLSGFLLMSVVYPFIQPFGLTLTQIKINPIGFFSSIILGILVICLLIWLVRELGKESVVEARRAAGRKIRNIKIPFILGGLMAIIAGVSLILMLNGESGKKASKIALEQVGSNYSAHVSSIKISKKSQGTYVSGLVTVWNEIEIRTIHVAWQE